MASIGMVSQQLSHRPVQDGDIPLIGSFPMSLEEVSYMFRDPEYPLPTERLRRQIRTREAPTVVLLAEKLAGFATLYDCLEGESCSIGNVIVDPHQRGKGVARYLIETMVRTAAEDFRAREVKLVCFNRNIAGLLLYTKLGFEPYAIEARKAPGGDAVAAIRMRRLLSTST